jgi:hypothetical protein
MVTDVVEVAIDAVLRQGGLLKSISQGRGLVVEHHIETQLILQPLALLVTTRAANHLAALGRQFIELEILHLNTVTLATVYSYSQ